ncbi:MAG: rhodanese-like domain-containing protein [Bacteroidetes bacterium]|nr:rhodanese-like domain-containing protein [Bacteroidota bacterium]
MIKAIKRILGISPKTDYGALMREGAIILDVRSRGEYETGHIRDSINIPVDQLSKHISKLGDKNKCIICCCASGMRSGSAKRILDSHGFKSVLNGGGWRSLQNKILKE